MTCHPDLIILSEHVIKHIDCTVVWGYRTEKQQNDFYEAGTSQLKYPNSEHNIYPSNAIDLAPYIDGHIVWEEKQCYYFSGMVIGIAKVLYAIGAIDSPIDCGADWDGDMNISDQSFQDICHFQRRTKT